VLLQVPGRGIAVLKALHEWDSSFFFVGSFLLCEDYRYRKEILHIENHTSSNTGSRCSVLLVGGAVEGLRWT